MQALTPFLNTVTGSEGAVLTAVFIVATILGLIVTFALVPMIETRRRLKAMGRPESGQARRASPGPDGDNISEELQSFYDTFLEGDKNSLKSRLIQAGYFSPRALIAFNFVRVAAAMTLFVAAYALIDRMVSTTTTVQASMVAGFVGMLGFILPNFILDAMARNRREQYRRSFPDFVDMLVVCADAGLSIEAAAQRVARQTLARDRAFGIHLGVMMLEVRAGKRLRDALHSLSDRTGLEEAKTLGTLFRQSEELGVSLTRALRTHSKEMRQIRMLKAEEKANVLPVKLLMPLGAFVFPVTLVIILVPVMMKLLEALKGMSPSV